MTEQIASTLHGTGAPSVLVDDGVHSSPGHPATLRVHVRNLAGVPRDLSITMIGLDDGWAPEPVVLRDVPADMTVSAEAALVPAAGAVPGDYPFVVVVQALAVGEAGDPAAGQQSAGQQSAGQQTTVVETCVTVDAPSQVLLTVEPADSRMRLRRTVAVVLSNTGGEPVDVSLSTTTEKGLRLQLSEREVVVPARTTVRLTGQARNLRPQLMGHLSRRSFSVMAAGRQAPARFSGTITARPLLSAGFLRVMSLVLVMAMWAGGLVVALPWLTDRMTTQETTAEATGAPADPGSGAADGDPGDPSEGTGPGSPTGDDADTATDPTVRIGGVVTATDPSGVTVQIAPASIIADATATGAGAGGGGGAGGVSSSVPVPAHAVLGARLAADTDPSPDGGPLTKTAARAVALESTTAAATARATSTGDDGAWAFAGLSPNLTYLVTISKPGYQTVRHVVSGSEAAAGLDVELLAGDGRLSGQVTGPDGAGAGGVDVVITDGTTTVTTSTATTGAIGSWSVDGLSTPSTYLVTAQGNGLGAQSRLVALPAGGTAAADMSLDRGVAALSGMVTGPDSLGFTSGVGGARVTASDGTTTRTASTVTSGMVGSFTLVDLPIPGSYEITVEADGYATQTLQLALDDATSATPVAVAMRSASGAVQGRVTDTAGHALTSAGVTLHNSANTYKTMVTGDGTFRLNGIAPGEYVVSAAQFGHLTGYATVRASAGFATTVDLVLTEVEGDGLVSTSRIRGRVGDARTNGQLTCSGVTTGEPCLVTTTLTAQNVDGTQRVVSVTSDPSAEYLIPAAEEEGLLPGLYVLEVSAPGYEPSSIRVSVPMDTTVTAGQVALFPSPSLTGTVLARVGSVPEGTCVVVVPSGATAPTSSCTETSDPTGAMSLCVIDAPARCGLTGVNGGYTITNLASGTYSASVVSGDPEYVFTDDPTVLSLAAGDVRRYDAVLNRLARISVTTLINRGASTVVPAAAATVTPYLLVDGEPDEDQGQLTANAQGLVQFTKLPPGRYRFDVTSAVTPESPVQLDGRIDGVVLGYNQELTNQLVLTNAARAFQGRLVTQLRADTVTGADRVKATVTGITGFVGATPSRRSVVVTSDADGYITTQSTDPRAAGYLPVVTDAVDVSVDGGTVYRDQTFQNVGVASTATQIELEPLGVPFHGTLTLTGAPLPAGDIVSTVTFEVLTRPPGSGAVSISAVDASTPTAVRGTLAWSDMTQPTDASGPAGARLLRPGTYTVRASRAGFDPVDQTFTILPGDTTSTAVPFELKRFGDLRVATFTSTCDETSTATCTEVANPVVTLRSSSGQRTETAAPGQNYVDFGEIPSGTYRVSVQAAGFVAVEKDITVTAGQSAITQAAAVLLQQYGSITGTVSALVGNARQHVAGARITATRTGPDVAPGEASFTTVSDALGRYQLAGSLAQQGLRAGTWQVTASLLGYGDVTLPAVTVTMGGPTAQNIELTLEPVDLKVTVVKSFESGEGIDGLSVRLSNPGGPVGALPCTHTSTLPGCPSLGAGEYLFLDVMPVQSTLEINGVDQGHSRLSLVVNPVLGQDPWVVTVPLVSMTNTVRGTVLRQSGAGAPVALTGAEVTLTDTSTGAVVTTLPATAADGVFDFDEIPDGTYTVTSSMTGYETVARTLTVRAGQVAVLDLIMFPVTRQVTVTVTSGSGSDLTGTLVGLSTAPGATDPASLAAQPLVRSTGHTYTTVFNQVPTGAWTATVTGAAGHPWTMSAAVTDDGAAPVTVSLTATEVSVTLSGTGPAGTGTTLEATITGTVSGASTAITPVVVVVPVGSGSRTVSLLAGSYTVTPAPSAGWTVAPSTLTVTPDQREVVASFALSLPPITPTTVVTGPTGTVRVGDTATLTATVRAGTAAVTRGQVTFTLGGQTYGPATVNTAGVARHDVTITRAMATGAVSLSARYDGAPASSGSAEVLPSNSLPVTVTIALRETSITSAVAVPGVETVTFTAAISPGGAGAGSMTFAAPGVPEVCTSVVISGQTSCTVSLPAGTYPRFVATFTPSDGDYAVSTASVAPFTVSAPPPTPTDP